MSLQLKDVSYTVERKQLLSDINISIQPAKINSFIGPNGAGKTTLLRVASGALSAPGVTLNRSPLRAFPLDERARKVACLNQSSELEFPFKCFEVLRLGRIPHRTSRRYDERIVEEVISRLGLDGLAERIYTTLSGGEKQRVAAARVLFQKPKIYFADEPASSLDAYYAGRILGLLRQEADEKGKPVLCVLHNAEHIQRFADIALSLNQNDPRAHKMRRVRPVNEEAEI